MVFNLEAPDHPPKKRKTHLALGGGRIVVGKAALGRLRAGWSESGKHRTVRVSVFGVHQPSPNLLNRSIPRTLDTVCRGGLVGDRDAAIAGRVFVALLG